MMPGGQQIRKCHYLHLIHRGIHKSIPPLQKTVENGGKKIQENETHIKKCVTPIRVILPYKVSKNKKCEFLKTSL